MNTADIFTVLFALAVLLTVQAMLHPAFLSWFKIAIRQGVDVLLHHRQKDVLLQQWAIALIYIAGGIQSGATLENLFHRLSREAPHPLSKHIQRGLASAYLSTEKKISLIMPGTELAFARSAMLLYLQSGGRVARLLETAATILQERLEAKLRVKALTAQSRASAWIVAFTPFLLGGVMAVLAPDLTRPLYHTQSGWLILSGVIIMTGIGLYVSHLCSKVEP